MPAFAKRRRLLLGLLATPLASLLGCNKTANANNRRLDCLLSPEQMEGPYFVDEKLLRSDIRAEPQGGRLQPGMPLHLTLNVLNADCKPLANAIVDIWHCNAHGIYSAVRDRSFDTRGKRFLRGYQRTDAAGQVRFTTIYPGWYEGRTVHIHVKVRTAADSQQAFTSQLYFDDSLSDEVYKHPAYAGRGSRRTRNQNDFIFAAGGQRLKLKVSQNNAGALEASFNIGLDFA